MESWKFRIVRDKLNSKHGRSCPPKAKRSSDFPNPDFGRSSVASPFGGKDPWDAWAHHVSSSPCPECPPLITLPTPHYPAPLISASSRLFKIISKRKKNNGRRIMLPSTQWVNLFQIRPIFAPFLLKRSPQMNGKGCMQTQAVTYRFQISGSPSNNEIIKSKVNFSIVFVVVKMRI
jgi:hypothetical protein